MPTPATLWDVRTRLTEIFRDAIAASTTRGRRARVFEGTRSTGGTPDLFLLVGAPSALDDELLSNDTPPWGRITSVPDPMGPGSWLLEEAEIDCSAVAWSGSTEARPELRLDVSDVVATCQAALASDPKLGGLLEGEHRAQLAAQEFRDPLTADGPFAEVVFTVVYTQRVVI